MDSPPISRVRFADRNTEHTLAAPVEWQPCWLVLDVAPEDWSSMTVLWNDTPLAVQMRRTRSGSVWVVCELPRQGAGMYRLELRGRYSEERVVRIGPRKLDDAAFEAMITSLQEGLPREVAIALQRGGALAGVELQAAEPSTLGAERLRLQRAIQGTRERIGLLELLPRIARAPHTQLDREERWVDTYAARNLDPGQLTRALERPGNVQVDGSLARVVDRRTVLSLDTYENRVVRSFVKLVRGRAGRLVMLCEQLGIWEMRTEVAGWVRQLDAARRVASFLDEVSDQDVSPSRPTMVLMRQPAYRATLDAYLAFLRSSPVRLDSPWIDAPLKNVPELYQLWGTLETLVAVIDLAVSEGFRVTRQNLVRTLRGSSLVQVFPNGVDAVRLEHPTGAVLTVTPERTFGRGGRMKSITYHQIPDITVEITAHGRSRLWIFDPKYKLIADDTGEGDGKPTKVDLDKMHAYRDAIRGADGKHVVAFAGILYPGTTLQYGGDLAAIRAWPGESAGLRTEVENVLREAVRAAP